MLKHLCIQNFVLIEKISLNFQKGFNALSGETGSGKSAIIHALNLLCGERADTDLIRHESDKASVNGVFEIEGFPQIKDALEESGIECEQGEDLLIQREILLSGKNRCFVNNQPAHLSLLKKIGSFILDIVDQHSSISLKNIEQQAKILDEYGEVEENKKAFKEVWEKEKKIEQELAFLIQNEGNRLQEIEKIRGDLIEINELNPKEGEEEELFLEYQLLVSAEERSQKSSEILQCLISERTGSLITLNKAKTSFEKLAVLDPLINEVYQSYKSALLELEEVTTILRNYRARIENPEDRKVFVNERLSFYNQLKKKYGKDISQILQSTEERKKCLDLLEKKDLEIEELKQALEKIKSIVNQKAAGLTKKRNESAIILEQELTLLLQKLNMPHVQIGIHILPKKRDQNGDDQIEFYLKSNKGEASRPLKDCASGGEMSRILLAIRALLTGKDKVPILVFDEIDSGVGGETAHIVGKLLKQISQNHQVLCITHFPQVAYQAEHHFLVSKHEKNGRTFTQMKKIESNEREKELNRMVGGIQAIYSK